MPIPTKTPEVVCQLSGRLSSSRSVPCHVVWTSQGLRASFPAVLLAVGEKAVKAEVCIDGGKPLLADFSSRVLSIWVSFMLNAPFTSYFPYKVHRFGDEDCVGTVHSREWVVCGVTEVTYCAT